MHFDLFGYEYLTCTKHHHGHKYSIITWSFMQLRPQACKHVFQVQVHEFQSYGGECFLENCGPGISPPSQQSVYSNENYLALADNTHSKKDIVPLTKTFVM